MSGPPNLAEAIECFAEPVTRRRYTGAPTVNAEGIRTAGAFTDTPIRMHVYPAPGKKQVNKPQGKRPGRMEVGGTTADVRTGTKGGLRADDILYDGAQFEVTAVQNWSGYIDVTLAEVKR